MRIEWMEKYLTEAEQLIYDNRVNEGIALLQNLLYDEPGYGFLHNHLGWAYVYYTSDVGQAELHLTMAIKFDGTYPAPYIHLGNLYIRDGRYAEAIKYLELGIQKPNAHRLTFLEALGQAYELRGDFGQAGKAYREATMASVASHEIDRIREHIKRCRKKKWAMMFGFL
jgi:Flp pilus assembly protein TadD